MATVDLHVTPSVASAQTAEWLISSLQRVLRLVGGYQGVNELSTDQLDACITTVELVYRKLLIRECTQSLTNNGTIGLEHTRMGLEFMQEFREARERQVIPQMEITGSVGRPRFLVTFEQLESLVESHFTVSQIASILGVSSRTVHRRMAEFGLSVSSQYAEISDEQFVEIIGRIQNNFPTCGNRQMRGHLLALGLRVQQSRIRDAQRRVDPCGSLLRHLSTVNRRTYHVAGPKDLYHIDGNHKLIRFA